MAQIHGFRFSVLLMVRRRSSSRSCSSLTAFLCLTVFSGFFASDAFWVWTVSSGFYLFSSDAFWIYLCWFTAAIFLFPQSFQRLGLLLSAILFPACFLRPFLTSME